jgi:hypothetical protein
MEPVVTLQFLHQCSPESKYSNFSEVFKGEEPVVWGVSWFGVDLASAHC